MSLHETEDAETLAGAVRRLGRTLRRRRELRLETARVERSLEGVRARLSLVRRIEAKRSLQ